MIQTIPHLLCFLLLTQGALWAQTTPVLSNLEGDNLTYTEGDPATVLTNTIEVGSDAPISRVVVQLTENYVSEQDQLLFTGGDNIRGVYDQATATLSLLSYPAGSAGSAVSFQNALRTIRYFNNNSENPQAGLRSITVQAFNEQGLASNVVTRKVSVVIRESAPELAVSDDSPIPYAVGSGSPVSIFPDLSITDPDSEFIESATVTINEGYRLTEDELSVLPVPSSNISVAGSGGQTLTFNGKASIADYQNALQGVQFSNSSAFALATEGNRKISVSVNDGSTQSIGLARFVAVGNSTNVPPAIGPVNKSTTTNTDLSFTLTDFSDQYQDAEGNTSFTGIYIRSQPRRGTLIFKGSEVNNSSINTGLYVASDEFAALIYQPAVDFVGDDQFLWNASDGASFAANNVPVQISVVAPELAVALNIPEAASTEEDTELRLPPIEVSATQEVPITVTLTVSNGVLTLPSEIVPLIAFSAGDGTGDPSMVFTGTPSEIAYALSGIQYLPNLNYNGSDVLSVNISAASSVSDQGTLPITIIPGNDPFRLSTIEEEPLTYTENDPPITLTNQLTIEDLDTESTLRIASATVTISEGYVPGEDQLLFDPLLSITGTQRDNVLTLTGVSDVSNYQSALRTVRYQNTSDAPAPSKTVSFTLLDEADSTSNTVTRTINIQSVEDVVQLTNLETFPINYVVENDFTTISNTITVTDPDSRTLDQVIISFSEGYDPALDSLYLDGVGDLDVQWNDAQGRLVLAGINTLEAYTLALRAVRYRSNGTSDDDQSRTISIQAFSGSQASDVVSRSLVLIANDPPEVADFDISVAGGIPYIFTLSDFAENYSDPDNAPVADQPAEIRILSLPENGVLLYQDDTLRAEEVEGVPGGYIIAAVAVDNESLAYIPSPGFSGTDEISWNAFDGAEIARQSALVRMQVLESLTIALSEESAEVCVGNRDTLEVMLTSGQADAVYQWSCAGNCGFVGPTDQSAVVIAPNQSTQYVVSVSLPSVDIEAQDSVSVTVIECPVDALVIPNYFTPDADGVNDEWVVENLPSALPFTVEVFDRYGNSVYRSEDYQNDWQGTYEGKTLPVGTYYYFITNPEGDSYKGAINILR